MSLDDPTPADVISQLGLLRQACGLVQVAIPVEQLTSQVADQFAGVCEDTVRAVTRLCSVSDSPNVEQP